MPLWMEYTPGLFVLAVLAVCLWFLRRKGLAQFNLPGLGGKSSPKQVQVMERTALSAQHSLYLVKVGELKMLVGSAPASCNLLAILPRESGDE